MFMTWMLACSAPNAWVGETIDLVDGTYVGYPADGDPAKGVKVRDANSTLTVQFYEQNRELWALVSFRGRMVVKGWVIKAEDSTIEGVTVDGDDLWCQMVMDGVNFGVTGLFMDDRASLYLDITRIGTLTLYREDDVERDTGAGLETGAAPE